MFTIVLPCAGAGTRLGLPYPKELHVVEEGRSLVDYSLAHLSADPALVDKAVCVIAPGKERVPDYVAGRMEEHAPVETAYFNEAYSEWPGSIRSAETHFGARNIALLPDSRVTPEAGARLLPQFAEAFESGADVVFAYKRVSDPAALAALGAISVEGEAVTDFFDKPRDLADAARFNAFWVAFGFTRDVGPSLLELMQRSVARERVDLGTLGCAIRGFEVADYIDLGTWPSIHRYLGLHGA